VIVVNYNSRRYLGRCLQALAEQTFRDFDVVVVDNGSREESVAMLLPDDPRYQMIELPTNLGFAAANNRGAEGCTAPWIATLNPDAFPEPDWLERLLEATVDHPAAMYGSTQIAADNPRLYDGTGDGLAAFGIAFRSNYRRPVVGPIPTGFCFGPCAAAALYDRRAFEAAGGFDERFFCYSEDVDLAFRLRLAGGKCWQVDRAKVLHVGSATTGRGSDFSYYHGFRNQFWMLLKCLPTPLLVPLLPAHLLAVGMLILIWRGRRKAIAGGIWAALKGTRQVWADRRRVQTSRTVSSWAVVRVLTWNPLTFLRRNARPWQEDF
jgi:GT2 family glycosyltransferase